jgi:single-stranded-DNA-specific exonuclease
LALRKYLRERHWFVEQQLPEPNLAQLLDLVALGTVADVVPLDANNRILVSQGLKRIRAGQTRPGIQALIEIASKNQQQLVASDFGFALGPRINAAGRLEDMAYGINCLLANDLMSARAMAAELDELNRTRREIEQEMQTDAERILQRLNFDEQNLPAAIALYQPDWHQGVIGIVAGRLKEKYHRPTVVFAGAFDEATGEIAPSIKGSARSIDGLHIRDLFEQMATQQPELIDKFGGHAMAAGLSIKAEHFPQFQQNFVQLTETALAERQLAPVIYSDGALAPQQMQLAFAQMLRDAGPWGQQFSEPMFDDQFELVQQRIVGSKHLKCVLGKNGQLYDGIAFNTDVKQWPNPQAKQVHVAFKLDINEFRGQRNVQLLIEQIVLI